MMKLFVLALILILSCVAKANSPSDDSPTDEALLSPTENCISIVGDSVAFGSLVVMIPAHGFATIRTAPLSDVMEDYLENEAFALEVRDRSVAASSLTTQGDSPYDTTAAYTALLADRCAFIWILPWVNDLTYGGTLRYAHAYVYRLQDLVKTLLTINPEAQIIISGYYQTRPASFTTEYYGIGVRPKNIDRFNSILFAACEDSDWLGAFHQVECMDTESAFTTEDDIHILRRLTKSQLEFALYEPPPDESQPLFNAFWTQNPDGRIRADGVHLTATGKHALVHAFFTRYISP